MVNESWNRNDDDDDYRRDHDRGNDFYGSQQRRRLQCLMQQAPAPLKTCDGVVGYRSRSLTQSNHGVYLKHISLISLPIK